jgi:hypothetical protein
VLLLNYDKAPNIIVLVEFRLIWLSEKNCSGLLSIKSCRFGNTNPRSYVIWFALISNSIRLGVFSCKFLIKLFEILSFNKAGALILILDIWLFCSYKDCNELMF